jgi:hypothetical protein
MTMISTPQSVSIHAGARAKAPQGIRENGLSFFRGLAIALGISGGLWAALGILVSSLLK